MYIYIYIYIHIHIHAQIYTQKVKLATVVEGDL